MFIDVAMSEGVRNCSDSTSRRLAILRGRAAGEAAEAGASHLLVWQTGWMTAPLPGIIVDM